MARIRIVQQTQICRKTVCQKTVPVNLSKKIKTGMSSLSYGMIRKLEPLLKLPRSQRKATNQLMSGVAEPQEERKQNLTEGTSNAMKLKDVFAFPSSPKETEKESGSTSKDRKEKKPCLQMKIKKENKRKVDREVIEIIRKTRENIQSIRSGLKSFKNIGNVSPKTKTVYSTQRDQRGTKEKINVTISVAGLRGIKKSQSQSCIEEEEIGFCNGRKRNDLLPNML